MRKAGPKVYLGAVTAAMQEGLTAMSKQPLTVEVLAAIQNLSTAVGVVVNVSKTLAAADKTAGERARWLIAVPRCVRSRKGHGGLLPGNHAMQRCARR